MLKFIVILLSPFFLGVILLVLVLRVVGWTAIKEAALVFFGPGGFLILVLSAILVLLGGVRWRYILSRLGYDIPFKEAVRLYLVHFSISFFLPKLIVGGEAIRTYAVRERYNIPWVKVVASVIAERILELTWAIITVVVGALVLLLLIGLPPVNIALILVGAFLFFVVPLTFFYFRSFRRKSIIKIFLRRAERGNNLAEIEREVFSFFRPKSLFMWQAFGLTALRGAFNFARIWLLILFLGKAVGPLPVLTAFGFFYLAFIVPTPATLGIHDALQAFSFGAMGLGKGTGAAFTMILRGADILLALFGIAILVRLGIDLFKISLFKKAERFVRK